MQQHDSSLNLLSPLASNSVGDESSLQHKNQHQYNNTNTNDTRQIVEDQLHELLQVLFDLTVMVHDFQPNGNQFVWNKINSVLEHYKQIDELKSGLTSYIPEEVINYVENGQNPDLFTQAFISRTATENQFTNGKIKAVDSFRSLLSDEFAKSFPDLYENNNDLDAP
ncbi:transcription factor subunit Med10 of mediator complex-domain-containing protein [Chlamydoabsidia padenii]|nr:transcription factor subunit Med10 of mediator complex-domain-containing protein [Chlamydoabsidia padenii]